jgi:hypothetical protein
MGVAQGAIKAASGGGESKINLSLRTLKYEKELASMCLPKDTKTLIGNMLGFRRDGLEVKYNMAFHYTELKKRRDFWTASGYKSLDAWLVAFDMPHGETLAMREHMVKLFSKETFLLVGDQVLGNMLLQVSRHVDNIEGKKKAYQTIFDTYCKSHDTFDKKEFGVIVNWYINTRIRKPKGEKVTDNTATPPRTEPKGARTHKALRDADEAEAAPVTETDTIVETTLCAGCKLWQEYARQLEQIITSEMGAQRLPKRPQGL